MAFLGNSNKPQSLPRIVERREPSPDDYAPSAKKRQLTLEEGRDYITRTVATFAELPTKQLDEQIANANKELRDLETTAARVRAAFMECNEGMQAKIERLMDMLAVVKDTAEKMEAQCLAVNKEATTQVAVALDEIEAAVAGKPAEPQ